MNLIDVHTESNEIEKKKNILYSIIKVSPQNYHVLSDGYWEFENYLPEITNGYRFQK